MLELKFQGEILKSARLMGGYGQKIAHRFKVGVPDLLVSMPESGLILLECKSLKEVGDNFNRSTGITSIQQEILTKYNAANVYPVGAQLIYVLHRGVARAVVWPADAAKISADYERESEIWVERGKKAPHWDMMKLARAVKLVGSLKSAEKLTGIL